MLDLKEKKRLYDIEYRKINAGKIKDRYISKAGERMANRSKRNEKERLAYASSEERRERARAACRKYQSTHREKLATKRKRHVEKLKQHGLYADYRRRQRLAYKYGLSVNEWEGMFNSQDGKCACCGGDSHKGKYGWVVDHNHLTGEVRGIVCNPCNVMIGMAKDSVEILAKGIKYLSRNKCAI